jgi:RNA polymerase sigma-70 factor, ECF subfamily
VDDDDLAVCLAAAIGGDTVGFAAVWRSLQPALLRYLRVLVGGMAEDVASETWLQAARDLSSFDGDLPSFRVWLFRIARNRGIDELRRSRRRREEPREPADLGGQLVRDVAHEVVERSDTRWAIEMIRTLPRGQAEALMLRLVVGLDAKAAALVLGKRPGAVRVATMRGLRQLAAHTEVRQRGSVSPLARITGSTPVTATGSEEM